MSLANGSSLFNRDFKYNTECFGHDLELKNVLPKA